MTPRLAAAGRIYGYVAALLALPAVVLSKRHDVLFTPTGWTDPWFYLGYARNLVEFKRHLFPELYYGTRLAWILPAAAVHSVFPPVAAAYVLHLAVWTAVVLPFFFAMRWIAGARGAFLASALLAMHPWLWRATGWDYPDGAAVAYAMAATALYTRAALRPPSRALLLIAGAAAACTLHCNLFWAALAPVLPLTYIALAYAWHQRSLVRASLEAALWSGLGGALLTAALCGVNYWLDGDFWLFGPSLRQGSGLVRQSSVWTSGLWGPMGLQPWLWFAAAGLAVSAVLLAGWTRRGGRVSSLAGLAFSLELWLAVAALCYLQSTPVLGLACLYYTSGLIPFTFLVVGTAFWKGMDDLRFKPYLAICAASLAAFGFAWYGGGLAWLPAGVAAGLILALLVYALCTRRTMAAALAASAGLAILSSQVRLTRSAVPQQARRDYERITRTRARLEGVRHGRRIRFWFDQRDPEFPAFSALSSTYLANWSFLNTDFPKLTCEPFTAPDTGVVVLSTRADAAEVAGRALADCWRKDGLLPRVEDSAAAEGVARSYTMTAFFAQPGPAARRPLRAVFDAAGSGRLAPLEGPADGVPFPLDRWRALERTAAQFSPAEVRVRTSREAFAFALIYPPLVAPVAARYSFTLSFRRRSGGFAFGLCVPHTFNWTAVAAAGARFEPPGDVVVSADLKQGEAFELAIENNENYGDRPAAFAIRELTAVAVDPDYARNSSTASTTRAGPASYSPR